MENIHIININDVCRLCLENSKLFISITTNEIITMITTCASVQISENDKLPQQICNTCHLQLQNAYQLKKIIEQSDIMLREALIYQSNENIVHFDDNNDDENVIDVKIEDRIDTDIEEKNTQMFDERTLLRIQHITDVEHKYAKVQKDNDENNLKECDKIESEPENLLEINKIVLENLNLVDDKSKPHNKQTYECEKCKKPFNKASELGTHMKRFHNVEPLACKQCTKLCYHELHLKSHMKIHTRGNFICDVCNKKLSSSHKLARHKISHSTERPFPCLQCSSTFKDKWVLFKHIKNVHMNMEKHAECPICHKSFVSYRLKDHLVIHEKERETFPCDICAKILYSKVSLVKHKQLYHMNITRESKHLCNICGKSSTSAALLKAHLLTHTGEKPFECDQCNNKYRTKFALKKHVSRVHLMERNHVCGLCSAAFADKKTLMNHVRHHTGLERKFQCKYCEKAFVYKTGLKYHMKTHHSL